jgi:hypothetical protein
VGKKLCVVMVHLEDRFVAGDRYGPHRHNQLYYLLSESVAEAEQAGRTEAGVEHPDMFVRNAYAFAIDPDTIQLAYAELSKE